MRELLPLELHLRDAIEQHAAGRRIFYVAFSGGKDSTALLYATAAVWQAAREQKDLPNSGETPAPSKTKNYLSGTDLRAWHINHGLTPRSDEWATHCRQVCAELNVPLVVSSLKLTVPGKESAEMAARRGRYAVWRDELPPGSVLLLAHHMEDQAETLLLQLMRGNPSGMPLKRPLVSAQNLGERSSSFLLRPFLNLSEESMRAYLRLRALRYLADPTNADPRHERNYIRHRVLPVLKKKWGGASRNLAFAAERLAAQREAADAYHDTLFGGRDGIGGKKGRPLSLELLLLLPEVERTETLLAWLRACRLPPPARAAFDECRRRLNTKSDTALLLEWEAGSIRQYKKYLYAMPPLVLPDTERQAAVEITETARCLLANHAADKKTDTAAVIAKMDDTTEEYPFPGQLRLRAVQDKGMRPPAKGERVLVKHPVPVHYDHHSSQGDRFRLAGRDGSRTLKKLLQEAQVPPWLRPWLPMIYINDELAALANLGVLPEFVCKKGTGIEIDWVAPIYGLAYGLG